MKHLAWREEKTRHFLGGSRHAFSFNVDRSYIASTERSAVFFSSIKGRAVSNFATMTTTTP